MGSDFYQAFSSKNIELMGRVWHRSPHVQVTRGVMVVAHTARRCSCVLLSSHAQTRLLASSECRLRHPSLRTPPTPPSRPAPPPRPASLALSARAQQLTSLMAAAGPVARALRAHEALCTCSQCIHPGAKPLLGYEDIVSMWRNMFQVRPLLPLSHSSDPATPRSRCGSRPLPLPPSISRSQLDSDPSPSHGALLTAVQRSKLLWRPRQREVTLYTGGRTVTVPVRESVARGP